MSDHPICDCPRCGIYPEVLAERDRLKAELSKSEMGYRGASSDRDSWRDRCEKMGEALKDIESDKRTPPSFDQGAVTSFFMAFRIRAREALKEYEAWKKGKGE